MKIIGGESAMADALGMPINNRRKTTRKLGLCLLLAMSVFVIACGPSSNQSASGGGAPALVNLGINTIAVGQEQNSLVVSWQNPSQDSGIGSYNLTLLHFAKADGDVPLRTIGPLNFSYTGNGNRQIMRITNILNNGFYSIEVVAIGMDEQIIADADGLRNVIASRIPKMTPPDTLSNLQVIDPTTSSLTISWNSIPDTAYDVIRNGTILESNLTSNSFMDMSLQPNTFYQYLVRSCFAQQLDVCSLFSSIEVLTPLPPPSALSVRAVTNPNVELAAPSLHTFEITWQQVPGAAYYEISRNQTIIASDIIGLSYLDNEGLRSQELYSYSLRACSASRSCSAESATANGRTAARPTTEIPNLQGANITAVSLDVQGTAAIFTITNPDSNPLGISTYNITLREFTSAVGGEPIGLVSTDTSFTNPNEDQTISIDTLTPGRHYAIEISARNSNDEILARLDADDFDIFPELNRRIAIAPLPVTNLQAMSIDENSIRVQWDEAAGAEGGAVHYELQRDATEIGGRIATTEFIDDGLMPNTQYSYLVRACSAIGTCSADSTAVSVSTRLLPPTNLRLLAVSASSINISWDEDPAADHYEISRNGNILNDDLSETNYSDTDLLADTIYSYSVRSCDANDICSRPATSSMETLLASPVLRAAVSLVPRSIDLRWNPVSGARYYEILRDGTQLEGETGREIIGTSFTDTGLMSTTLYSYVIRACASTGVCSLNSAQVSASTRQEIDDPDTDGIDSLYDTFAGAGATAGSGTETDPYIITNIYQLQAIAGVDHEGRLLNESFLTSNRYLFGDSAGEQLASHYRLGNDIDATATASWNDGEGFHPIGTCPNAADAIFACNQSPSTGSKGLGDSMIFVGGFIGSLDGAGFTISSLSMRHDGRDAIGLFGGLDRASVRNLALHDAQIASSSNNYLSGILAGYARLSLIEDVTLSGSLAGWRLIGAMAGFAQDSQITDSSVAAANSIRGSSVVGGLVGYASDGSIDNASVESGSIIGTRNIGGLVGLSDFADIIGTDNNAEVNVSHDTADSSTSRAENIGGLVGRLISGTIFGSYNSAAINILGGAEQDTPQEIVFGNRTNIGGLVGKIDRGEIFAAYSTGDISYALANSSATPPFASIDYGTETNVGGLVGLMEGGRVQAVYGLGNYSVQDFSSSGTLLGNHTGGNWISSYSRGLLSKIDGATELNSSATSGQTLGYMTTGEGGQPRGEFSGNINNSFFLEETSINSRFLPYGRASLSRLSHCFPGENSRIAVSEPLFRRLVEYNCFLPQMPGEAVYDGDYWPTAGFSTELRDPDTLLAMRRNGQSGEAVQVRFGWLFPATRGFSFPSLYATKATFDELLQPDYRSLRQAIINQIGTNNLLPDEAQQDVLDLPFASINKLGIDKITMVVTGAPMTTDGSIRLSWENPNDLPDNLQISSYNVTLERLVLSASILVPSFFTDQLLDYAGDGMQQSVTFKDLAAIDPAFVVAGQTDTTIRYRIVFQAFDDAGNLIAVSGSDDRELSIPQTSGTPFLGHDIRVIESQRVYESILCELEEEGEVPTQVRKLLARSNLPMDIRVELTTGFCELQ